MPESAKFTQSRTNPFTQKFVSLTYSKPRQWVMALLLLTLIFGSSGAWAQVFINELHYDNTGGDTGEAVEVAGPAATDLTGWTIVLYNGSNQLQYATINLAGVIPNQDNGFGTLDFAQAGIQNGAPDGLALVDDTATVIQFLSYEGSFTAGDGPANGMASTDIGVFEPSDTPIGQSLQLTGTGTAYADFTWQAPATSSFGSVNTGQTFGVPPEVAPAVSSTSPADTDTGVALDANIEITFTEDVTVSGSWFEINCTTSLNHPATPSGGPSSYSLDPTTDFLNDETCTVEVFATLVTDNDVDDPPDEMESNYQFSFTTLAAPVDSPMLINEVDADTPSTDDAEFIELFDGGAGSTALDGLVLVFFNGSDDASYLAFDLDGQSTDANGYFVLCGDAANVSNCDLDVSPNTNLIQNGADAVALYQGDAADFPNDTPVTANLLIDAIVYDTNDGDDAGLLPLLNGGQPQVNEGGGGNSAADSNQRCPNGAGGGRNTEFYTQAPPTPGAPNGCVLPLINEVDADTPGTDDAEFVELFSPAGGNFPLNGFSIVFYNGSDDASYLAFDLDGFSTDADGYFVLCGNAANVANCDLDVSPDTNLIQNGADAVALVFGNASDFPNDTPVSGSNLIDAIVYDTSDGDDAGLLGVLTPGQPQVNENENASGATESNQRCPNGFGGARMTGGYEQALPTPGASNACGALEIFEIQGAGTASPYAGFDVLTADNTVTAVGPEGFFIQTPDARADANGDTSNGIYVFTGGAPAVAVGDNVDVSGRIEEFFEFTEFTNSPDVTVISSGNALPTILLLDSVSVPSQNPAAPSCAIEYECFEGMLVQVNSGFANSGNQDFGGDPLAESYVTAAGSRTFREPGVEFPGLGGSIPTWDGNPEVFELDPDRLGLPNETVPGGSSFVATGVIGFEFGEYEIWPTALTVTPASLPVPVRMRLPGETTVGSFNLLRFATDGDYATRLEKLSRYIREVLLSPDILAVQEADNIGALLDLANEIAGDDASVNYTPYLVEGNDIGGIDVGFLVRSDIAVDSVTQLGAAELFTFDDPDSLLHDRPPLLLEGRYTGNFMHFPLAVLVVHNRSLNGIETERTQRKRLEQAQSVATMVQTYQTSNPDTPLIVVGDFNAFEFTDGYVDVVGHIKGSFNPLEELRTGPDLVSPDLTNQVDLLPASERYSFVFDGSSQALDHALTNVAANPWVRGLEFGRGNADGPHDFINDAATAIRSSDHDGLVLFLMSDADGDGVADDVDGCPLDSTQDVRNPSAGCTTAIPTLDPWAMLLMLLLLGSIGAIAQRHYARPY